MAAAPRTVLVAAAILLLTGPIAATAGGGSAHRLSGGVTIHTVVRGETLGLIGSTFGVDAATLAADNHLDIRGLLAVGAQLRIDNRHIIPADADSIVINVPQRMLFAADEGHVDGFPVAVGRPTWQTPTGAFTVISKEQDPTWRVPSSILKESARLGRRQPPIVPPGPGNPLGEFWIGLSLPGIGIHGTTAPASIYHAATHGCIRAGSANIRRLFPLVGLDTRGEVIYQPVLLAEVDGDVYLEVHRDVYGRLTVEPLQIVRSLAAVAALTDRIDWMAAAVVVAAHEGIARAVTINPDE
jgi:L,D-transpeptidase ErfK/SrfK